MIEMLRTLYVAYINGDQLDPEEEARIRYLCELPSTHESQPQINTQKTSSQNCASSASVPAWM
jgi:hypothetical protein